ncbi:MAG: hypothetical protein AAF183_24605, partial [Pseudomonadota bacterium]
QKRKKEHTAPLDCHHHNLPASGFAVALSLLGEVRAPPSGACFCITVAQSIRVENPLPES